MRVQAIGIARVAGVDERLGEKSAPVEPLLQPLKRPVFYLSGAVRSGELHLGADVRESVRGDQSNALGRPVIETQLTSHAAHIEIPPSKSGAPRHAVRFAGITVVPILSRHG